MDQTFSGRARRRFRRRPGWPLLVAAALATWAVYRCSTATKSNAPRGMREGNYQVDFVVDGDTLELRGGIRVRLIGVDTPETVKRDHPVDPCGPEATQFTRGFLAAGRADLRFDAERVDRHGRTLAYVSVDGKLLNEELILAGLGRYEPRFHYQQSMHRRFRLAEQAAKSAGRGLWSVRPCAQEPAK